MPIYQVQVKANRQTVNYDLEAKNKDSLLNFLDKISYADVVSIKRYVFLKDISVFNLKGSRYASIRVKIKNKPSFAIKIPNLKDTINEKDISNLLNSLYKNIENLSISISRNF